MSNHIPPPSDNAAIMIASLEDVLTAFRAPHPDWHAAAFALDEAARFSRTVADTLTPEVDEPSDGDAVCICPSHETCFEGNRHGHRVDCPCWGTDIPHRLAPRGDEGGAS